MKDGTLLEGNLRTAWRVIDASRTTDGSDLLHRLNPNEEQHKGFTVNAEEFIQSCSFDGRMCDYKSV